MTHIIPVNEVRGEARVSSRDLATALGNQHKAFSLLAEAMRCALNEDMIGASQALRQAKESAQPEEVDDIQLLSIGVIAEMARVAQARHVAKGNPHNEFAVVHFWFKNHFADHIPQGRIVQFQRRVGANPDFMIEVEGTARPVECKLKFDARALNQLLSYLAAYDAAHGYAVGLTLTCSLPENITFIACPQEATHA